MCMSMWCIYPVRVNACACVCTCVRKPEVNSEYVPQLPSFFQIRSLTGPGTHQFSEVGFHELQGSTCLGPLNAGVIDAHSLRGT